MSTNEGWRVRLARAFHSSPAGRRYSLRIAVAFGIYGAVFFVMRPFEMTHGAPALRAGLAVVLALSTIGVVWAIIRYLLEEDDEYLRIRQAQAVLAATALTLSVYTLWGYLTVFRLAPPLPAHDIFPLFSACWLVALGVRKVLGR